MPVHWGFLHAYDMHMTLFVLHDMDTSDGKCFSSVWMMKNLSLMSKVTLFDNGHICSALV